MTNSSIILNSPIGKLEFVIIGEAVHQVNLNVDKPEIPPHTEFESEISNQVDGYFSGALKRFTLPTNANVSEFQKRVLQALSNIPYGKTLSYGQLSKIINSSPRAVGGGCRRNPLPIIIPCHRVTAASDIGGFAGKKSGTLVQMKHWLIHHERANY
ncbi:methylated-DNA--[protein]-cysteine S-methyltransferase [Pleionea sediminis]|uniref:methylated-DNA--[protein]-cysteine S-methyltransferase n=1 Tax=Pleionea sediminis TaxID=2569479 RepID=UPI001185DF4D|nr:methylated-DNA--[protein]-cysteine S-methyltransferase [Pleionea sediminis]